MASRRDTICALASGPPPSAIAIIRVSGPETRDICAQILAKPLQAPGQMGLNSLLFEDGSAIDTGLSLFMAAPQSYTGEDTFEFYCHGGRYIVETLLRRLTDAGARLARPGEFTRRAFEAGKLDLTRAEAIADLIDAETEAQHRLARQQLDGALEQLYLGWNDRLTLLQAQLEARIDFPEEDDVANDTEDRLSPYITGFISDLKSALAEENLTEKIREGFRLVILGLPNAGKSTLLNRLAQRQAAIVTEIPGTTRDIVEVRLEIGGYMVWLSDTAGLREADDPIEVIGVARAEQAAEDADIRLWVYDARTGFDLKERVCPGDILIANKTDLTNQLDVSRETVALSAQTGEGISSLMQHISDRLNELAGGLGTPSLTRIRHRQGIQMALTHLEKAESLMAHGAGSELIAEEVRLAGRAISGLTGHVETERVLGAIFSTFCIGK